MTAPLSQAQSALPAQTATAGSTAAEAGRPGLPTSPLPGIRVVRLDEPWERPLQRFFEANPSYFLEALGEPPAADAAILEISDLPPEDFSYTEVFLLGFVQEDGELMAMASVVSDLLAPRVWHIGLFIVADQRHGTGAAQQLHGCIQTWAERHGAQWMRLGVVVGRARAERFWQRQGYVTTRLREGVEMGQRTHDLRVMVKPLGGHTLQDYLLLVARDRPADWIPPG